MIFAPHHYDEEVAASSRWRFVFAVLCACAEGQTYRPPAGLRPARTSTLVSILPGGRVLAPIGEQYPTGSEPMTLAVSASGKTVVSVNSGPPLASLTVLEHDKSWSLRHLAATEPEEDGSNNGWHSASGGLAFSGEHAVFVAEGRTGRIASIDLNTGELRRALGLDVNGGEDSVTGDLAFDPARGILYAADLAHSRVVALDTRTRQLVASVKLDGVPATLALSPDRRKLYAACVRNLIDTRGITGPNVSVLDVAEPRNAHVIAVVRSDDWSGSGLAGIAASEDRVFVSDSQHDSVTMIDARTNRIEGLIRIRIPGLDTLRGILPMGVAYDGARGWLLVAEAGINAVGVIDTRSRAVVGHLPVGWFPERVQVDRGTVYVLNRKGQGAGPDPRGYRGTPGSISSFPVPEPSALAGLTNLAMNAAGLVAHPGVRKTLPAEIRHVVVILKESRSFDDVLGDVTRAGNGPVMAAPQLARFGRNGYADGERKRLSLHHIDVTPNHHALAERWAFSDNFYADSDTNEDGAEWTAVWGHLSRHAVSFARFGEPFDGQTSDTERARRAIEEIEKRYGAARAELPQVTMIHLANDRMASPRPDAGYPYAESYVADNDAALGRTVEYLSHSRWWGQMAIFVMEASAERGADHIDANRTLLICAGPWARQNSVSHTNTGFAGLLKTIFELVHVPPMGLTDASAADLGECFKDKPDSAPYRAEAVDPRLYRP